MSFPLSDLLPRLRSAVDLIQLGKDSLSTDGSTSNIELSNSPIISGTETIYLNNSSFTTGVNQFVYPLYNGIPVGSSGVNIIYTIDYDRGELNFYQGSGTLITSTGLVPFAPWNNSTLTAYYEFTKYSDTVLINYLGFAVAEVEQSLQLGMYISGYRSGVLQTPPPGESMISADYVDQITTDPYCPGTKIVIGDAVDVLQDLIASRAFLDVITRERRVGAGNAIKIVDGDTQIDTSVNQRYLADFAKDLKQDYTDKLKWIMYNMSEGYTLQQINENRSSLFGNSIYQLGGAEW